MILIEAHSLVLSTSGVCDTNRRGILHFSETKLPPKIGDFEQAEGLIDTRKPQWICQGPREVDTAVAEVSAIVVVADSVIADENRKILQFNRQVVPIIPREAWDSEVAVVIPHAEATLHVVVADTGAATMVLVLIAEEWVVEVVAAMAEVQVDTEGHQAITVVITVALHHHTVKWVADINMAGITQDLHHDNSLTHDNRQTQPL